MIGDHMTRELFLKMLEESLRGSIPENELRRNLQYYQDYISSSMGTKSEQQVLDELGDPRLIARTIMDTYNLNHKKNSFYYKEVNRASDSQEPYKEAGQDVRKESYRRFRRISTLTIVIAIIITFLFFGLVFWIGGIVFRLFLRFILPILLIAIGISWIRKLLRR